MKSIKLHSITRSHHTEPSSQPAGNVCQSPRCRSVLASGRGNAWPGWEPGLPDVCQKGWQHTSQSPSGAIQCQNLHREKPTNKKHEVLKPHRCRTSLFNKEKQLRLILYLYIFFWKKVETCYVTFGSFSQIFQWFKAYAPHFFHRCPTVSESCLLPHTPRDACQLYRMCLKIIRTPQTNSGSGGF